MSKTVLVVDDDLITLELLRNLLTGAGYEVYTASTLAQAHRKVQRHLPSIAVVDVNLGHESGLDLVRTWWVDKKFPVLVLSGLGTPMDRVVGLELGADDYLAKPFEPRELVIRMRILQERQQRASGALQTQGGVVWQVGSGQFDERRRCLRMGGENVALSTLEFKLISYLIEQANRAVSREQIMDAVHHRDRQSSDRSVDVLIGRLRKKMAQSGTSIEAIRGLGYMLCGEVKRVNM